MLEFTDRVVGTVTTTQVKELTEREVEDIMVGAIEGGIGYWAGLSRDENWTDKPSDEPASTWATKLLLDGKSILFYDAEEGNRFEPLTLDMLISGYEMNWNERPHDADLDNADAITYDCIIQYALFREIVFG